ncbi:MAG: TrkA C-terminal domain-containing protein [Firmicutes bacterium]|nr:TrkA C-terminal domain-containing protein [Bacillota bacterium]MDD3298855.1 TrkA C-terminal domain-containing protein [Bacillota bacterium]MDD3851828.1 TrkA C-terminal domain-containing protein [Bacillota bacterium]MDD4708358.1 TrkA C-terminal domain-containing protein [Bacillota bacterium]
MNTKKPPKGKRDTVAKYEKIALDIAYSIVNGEWKLGEMVAGRSTLAGKYSVSPETIRRSLALLEELKVVNVIEKKGVLIKSKESANTFIKEYQSKDRILSMREEIAKLMDEKKAIEDSVMERLDSIIEQAMLLRNIGIIYPLELKISEKSHLIGKSIGEVRFWNHTGATIIGINRSGHLYLSPGPKMVFYANDIILYVGNGHKISDKVKRYVNRTK